MHSSLRAVHASKEAPKEERHSRLIAKACGSMCCTSPSGASCATSAVLSDTYQIALRIVITMSRCEHCVPRPVPCKSSQISDLQALHVISLVQGKMSVFLCIGEHLHLVRHHCSFQPHSQGSSAGAAAVVARGRPCSPCTYAAAATCSRLSKRALWPLSGGLASTPACKLTSPHLIVQASAICRKRYFRLLDTPQGRIGIAKFMVPGLKALHFHRLGTTMAPKDMDTDTSVHGQSGRTSVAKARASEKPTASACSAAACNDCCSGCLPLRQGQAASLCLPLQGQTSPAVSTCPARHVLLYVSVANMAQGHTKSAHEGKTASRLPLFLKYANIACLLQSLQASVFTMSSISRVI